MLDGVVVVMLPCFVSEPCTDLVKCNEGRFLDVFDYRPGDESPGARVFGPAPDMPCASQNTFTAACCPAIKYLVGSGVFQRQPCLSLLRAEVHRQALIPELEEEVGEECLR